MTYRSLNILHTVPLSVIELENVTITYFLQPRKIMTEHVILLVHLSVHVHWLPLKITLN